MSGGVAYMAHIGGFAAGLTNGVSVARHELAKQRGVTLSDPLRRQRVYRD